MLMNNSAYTMSDVRSSEPVYKDPTARWIVIGAVLLSTLISALLASSLLSAALLAVGQSTSGVWGWLLGSPIQTGTTATVTLLFGALMLGFSFGGLWFLIVLSVRTLRRRMR